MSQRRFQDKRYLSNISLHHFMVLGWNNSLHFCGCLTTAMALTDNIVMNVPMLAHNVETFQTWNEWWYSNDCTRFWVISRMTGQNYYWYEIFKSIWPPRSSIKLFSGKDYKAHRTCSGAYVVASPKMGDFCNSSLYTMTRFLSFGGSPSSFWLSIVVFHPGHLLSPIPASSHCSRAQKSIRLSCWCFNIAFCCCLCVNLIFC